MEYSRWGLIKRTFSYWRIDNISQLSAALAYYTIFSIAPLLLLCITVIGFFLGNENVKSQILQQLSNLFGRASANQINAMIQTAFQFSTNSIEIVITIIVLSVGLMGFFWELQSSVNKVWGVRPKAELGLWHLIRHRLLSFVLVLGIIFFVLVSLIVNLLITTINNYLHNYISQTAFLWTGINFLILFILMNFLFAMIFQILPDVKIKWRDAILGSIVTSFLFIFGKIMFEIYISHSHIASAYGAAGSLIVILIWVYYSAQILFIGIEFTKASMVLKGEEIVPASYAELNYKKPTT